MNRASAFGRGNWETRQLSYTAISYDVYTGKPERVDLDAITFADSRRYTPFTPLPDTHVWASFGHLGGYSSAYYTYLWDKVIAEDFFVSSIIRTCWPATPRRAIAASFSNRATPCPPTT